MDIKLTGVKELIYLDPVVFQDNGGLFLESYNSFRYNRLGIELDYQATIKLATLAKEAGVKGFIYPSSQRMYRIFQFDDALDGYENEKNPLTAYAKTKWVVEWYQGCDNKNLAKLTNSQTTPYQNLKNHNII